MVFTGCLPVVSMYNGKHQSGHSWSKWMLMWTVFWWGCSAGFCFFKKLFHQDLLFVVVTENSERSATTAKSSWRSSALKSRVLTCFSTNPTKSSLIYFSVFLNLHSKLRKQVPANNLLSYYISNNIGANQSARQLLRGSHSCCWRLGKY